jgi:hypothetical protein
MKFQFLRVSFATSAELLRPLRTDVGVSRQSGDMR